MDKAESTPASAAPQECAVISEKQFIQSHTLYSSISSWLFAIAGATNIGLLSVLAAKVLNAVEKGQPLFKAVEPAVKPVFGQPYQPPLGGMPPSKPMEPVFGNGKYNRMVLLLMAFGGVCMLISNWLESKKVVTEWQLGAGKLQRKAHIAEKEAAQAALTDHADSAAAKEEPQPVKQWAQAEDQRLAEPSVRPRT